MAKKTNDSTASEPVVKDKRKALKILNEIIERIDSVRSLGRKAPEFDGWKHDATVAVVNIFGENSINHRRFAAIRYSPSVFSSGTPDSAFEARWREGLDEASAILNSFLNQIQTYWDEPHESSRGQQLDPHNRMLDIAAKRVFIVHGHNDGLKQAVARLLEKLDIQPVVLHEQPNQGKTIIEKFEHYSKVSFALILLTADDEGRVRGEPSLRNRARQNVVLEWGFFLGLLGRERVCALYEDGVEIPSDYSGVLLVKVDSGSAWQYQVAKELRAAGVDVDLNKI
jgi:hypothetical protein